MPKTLLLADGSVTIQRVVELTFAHEDVRVVSVADGRRALQWLENDRPDIILADASLGEVDGYAVATHVRKVPRLRSIPVLLLAGAFEPVDQERARAAECDGIIVKPFEPKVLVTRVRELLDRPADATGRIPKETVKPAAIPTGPADSPALAFLRSSRSEEPEPARPVRIEAVPSRVEPLDLPAPFAGPPVSHVPAGAVPEPLELPARPVWETAVTPPPPRAVTSPVIPPPIAAPPPPAPAPATPPKVSLASAFSALLAAEQSNQPPAPTTPVVPDAVVEDAVRRVLARMTDEEVRRIVLETAERLIREEIEKIKTTPE